MIKNIIFLNFLDAEIYDTWILQILEGYLQRIWKSSKWGLAGDKLLCSGFLVGNDK